MRKLLMKKISISLIAMAAALAVAPIALADTITGTLDVAGNDVLTPTPSNPTAITFSAGTLSVLPDSTGSFTGVTDVTLTGFTFSAADNVQLFDLTSSTGTPITFTIDGPVKSGMNPITGDFSITGMGMFMEGGSDTPGTFNLANTSDGTFSISVQATAPSTGPVVPEPSSLVLLGSGLFALALFAFRRARPSGLILHS